MQKGVNIREQLGVTQEELALLLKVTRSQLSMYELGKRDLPIAAKKQLAELLLYVKEQSTTQKKVKSVMKEEVLLKKSIIEKLIHTNLHHQIKVGRALDRFEKKLEAGQASLNLIDFLENKTVKKEKDTDLLLKSMKSKSLNVVKKSNLATLTKLQIQKEVLEAEKMVLERFLQKL